MKLSATDCAVFARTAEDMFAPGVLTPELDERMAGWRIVGYLTALDALFGLQQFNLGERVFYGFVAAECADPTNIVAVVRGTELPIEWLIDLSAAPIPVAAGRAHAGFWSVYASLEFRLIDGDLGETAAIGIADAVHGGTVTVIGHSLGAALATYLTRDLRIASDNRFKVEGQFFASPKPGDSALADGFETKVGSDNYQVINYAGDIVPHMPPLGYSPLKNVRWLTAKLGLPSDPATNHSLYSYLARIRAEDHATTGETI